jgi:hypothetical protein
MPAIQFGLSSYERAEGDLPGLPVVNMYAEGTDSEGNVLQSRRGLSDRAANMGSGPVEALFRRDGVVSGNLLGVSGGSLYSATTSVGVVGGSGPVSIAGNETGVLVTHGLGLYSYDGTTFAAVSFPDSANVIKVIEGASRFIAIREGTGKFYFTPSLAQTFDALDFATAESEPDQLLDAVFIDDILVLFGKESIEFWPNTGDSLLPFRPLEGRVIEKGVKATGCATTFGSGFAWVTNENRVCFRDENSVLSNAGLEARIAASTNVRLFTFILDGNEFLALRLDTETQVFNQRAGTWSKFASYGQTNWIPQCFADGVFGSSVDGKTLQWGNGYQDLGGVLERRFRAGYPINGGGFIVNNLMVRTNPGNTPDLAGNYADPTIEARLSRDAGKTWGAWMPESLGQQGSYKDKVNWRALGQASYPGFIAELRVTDPVPFRASDVLINEPWGGR